MDLKHRHAWALELTAPDLNLVLKALGDRLTEDEMEQARELGDQITSMKARTLIKMGDDGEVLLQNLEDARDGKPLPKKTLTARPVGKGMSLRNLAGGNDVVEVK